MRLAAIHLALVGDQAELAKACIHHRFTHAMYVTLMRHAVTNQFSHSQHLEPVLIAELDEVGHAGHGAVVLHDFANDPGGNHSREAGEIDRGFGLSGADEYSALA